MRITLGASSHGERPSERQTVTGSPSQPAGWSTDAEQPPRVGRVTRLLIALPFGILGLILALVALAVVAMFAFGVFVIACAPTAVDLDRSSTSPDGAWTVRIYYHNPGAMASSWYTADVVDNSGARPTRQIFTMRDAENALWTRDGNHLLVRWPSPDTVQIGGHAVNVVSGSWSD
jgi:Family of unknown function (DUF5412)